MTTTLSWEIRHEDDVLPMEYVRFQFAREFGFTPKEVEEMDASMFWLWLGFMNAESEAARIGERKP